MQQVKDAEGTTWTISIDFGILPIIKQELGIRLALIEHPIVLPTDDPPDEWAAVPGIIRLGLDLELAYSLIYLLCREQAEELGLSNIQFARRIAKKGVQAKFFMAFHQEIEDFFQSTRKEHLVKVEKKYREFLSAAMDKMTETVERQVGLIDESEKSTPTTGESEDTSESIRDRIRFDSLTG